MTTKPSVPRTEYKEPKDVVSKLGYASSYINGNTVEGGLKNLTYKSIYALRFVEKLDLARSMIVPTEAEMMKISDHNIVSEEYIAKLRAEANALKVKDLPQVSDQQAITQLNQTLDTSLSATKSLDRSTSDKILFLSTSITSSMGVVHKKINLPVEVARMEQVSGFDGSAYKEAAARRKKELKEIEEARIAKQTESTQDDSLLEQAKGDMSIEDEIMAGNLSEFTEQQLSSVQSETLPPQGMGLAEPPLEAQMGLPGGISMDDSSLPMVGDVMNMADESLSGQLLVDSTSNSANLSIDVPMDDMAYGIDDILGPPAFPDATHGMDHSYMPEPY